MTEDRTQIEKDSLRQLRKIERELVQIKDRTLSPRRLFMGGILYGAGAFLGGILAIIFVGWLLSFLGIIPGLRDLVDYLRSIVSIVTDSKI